MKYYYGSVLVSCITYVCCIQLASFQSVTRWDMLVGVWMQQV